VLVYFEEVEYGRSEPKEDHAHRYQFQTLVEVEDATVQRWRQAIADYDRAQAEMDQVMDQEGRASERAHADAHMAKASFTPVGNCPDSPEAPLRPSPGRGHASKIPDV
jgi:hypothetical protein